MEGKAKRKRDSLGGDLSSFLPTAFGKKKARHDVEEAVESTRKRKVVKEAKMRAPGADLPEPSYVFGVNMPPDHKPDQEEERNNVELDEEVSYIAEKIRLPVSHEVEMRGHDSHVTALGIDRSGARMVSGGYDSVIKFWDFPAMDTTLRSFRTIEPEIDVISMLNFSPTGDRIIMVSNSPQARVYDREGRDLVELPKGYPYIRDMAATTGHTNHVTTAYFHPTEKETVITSSLDCTIRFWNLESYKKHKQIIKLKNAGGAVRSGVTTSSISATKELIAAVTQEGELHFYPLKGPYTKTSLRYNTAHALGSDTSAVTFSKDTNTVYTRGGDDTLKIWDLRKLSSGPVITFDNLPNKYRETCCVESPDGNTIVTGTSVKGSESDVGSLYFYDKATLTQLSKVDVSQESVISILWPEPLNQIICGCSDKNIHVLYNPSVSKKGVTLCVTKHPKRLKPEDQEFALNIQNPHALPLFKDQPSARRIREKARQDPSKSAHPEPPQIGPGVGGRLGSSLTASIMKDLVQKTEIHTDPREALLKHHQDNQNSYWFQAYAETQPKPIWRELDEEEEKDEK